MRRKDGNENIQKEMGGSGNKTTNQDGIATISKDVKGPSWADGTTTLDRRVTKEIHSKRTEAWLDEEKAEGQKITVI